MASFTENVAGPDVRFSQPVRTSVNDELNNSVSNAVSGLGKLMGAGVEFAAGMVTEDARTATVSALEDFSTEVATNPEIYNQIRSDLKGKYKAGVISKLTNTSLRDLKTVQIKKELEAKFGTSKLGRDSINQAMQDTMGYISPVFLAQKELRAAEAGAANKVISDKADLLKTFASSNVAIPYTDAGQPDYDKMTRIQLTLARTNSSIMSMAGANNSKGGATGVKVHDPIAINAISKDIGELYSSTLTSLFDNYNAAVSPDDRKVAAITLGQTIKSLQSKILSGKHPAINTNGANLRTSFNSAEIAGMFGEGEALVSQMMANAGIEDIGTLSPESITASHLARLDGANKTVVALNTKNMLNTATGRTVLSLQSAGMGEAGIKILVTALNDVEGAMVNSGISNAEARSVLDGGMGFIVNGKGKSNGHVGATALAVMFGDLDPKEHVEKWSKAIESIQRDGVVNTTKENRDYVIDAFDKAHSLNFFKELKKADPARAAEVYEFYVDTKETSHENKLTTLIKGTRGEDVTLKGKRFKYVGDDETAKGQVEDLNNSLQTLERFDGVVPDEALPHMNSLTTFFNKTVADTLKRSAKYRTQLNKPTQNDAYRANLEKASKRRKISLKGTD